MKIKKREKKKILMEGILSVSAVIGALLATIILLSPFTTSNSYTNQIQVSFPTGNTTLNCTSLYGQWDPFTAQQYKITSCLMPSNLIPRFFNSTATCVIDENQTIECETENSTTYQTGNIIIRISKEYYLYGKVIK